ncbi:tyrosine-type recombinase/integrase [Sulfobacillus harzensis]|uniref:Site-specific integrase n=1 Tax=Sulfobacillus harzensis TaxID=2729629 RepID=A0A7Y0L641_9FIRM|nr:site-specific integrase [Sulfobacillus harzensis]NMP23982.1 site-specific integrase [Sulfobacillus harzensis]
MPNRVKDPYAVEPRRLPSGRWKGRVVRYDLETGKRHELTQTFDSKREAKQWAETEAAKYRDDPNRKPPSEETVGEYLNRWLNDVAAGQVRDTTLIAYRRYVKPIMGSPAAQKPIRSVTALDFQGIYTEMTRAGKAATTVRHTHTVVRHALTDAVEWGLIPFNPVDRAKPPRKTTPPVETVPTPDEAKKLLEVADTHRLKALWYFLALSGCRRGEALGLQWTDIDDAQRIVYIRRTVTSDGAFRSIHEPKTAQGRRTLAVTPYLLDLLRDHRNQQDLERQAAGSAWKSPEYVFVTRQGGLLWPNDVWATFKRLLKKAGLRQDIRIHDLRHAMASFWLANGVPVKVVSERLGHANISITLQIYGHLLPNMQEQAAADMEAAFLGSRAADGPQKDPKIVVELQGNE